MRDIAKYLRPGQVRRFSLHRLRPFPRLPRIGSVFEQSSLGCPQVVCSCHIQLRSAPLYTVLPAIRNVGAAISNKSFLAIDHLHPNIHDCICISWSLWWHQDRNVPPFLDVLQR